MTLGRNARPPSVTGTLAGGVLGAALLVGVNQCAYRLAVTDLDLPRVLGLSFRDPGDAGVTGAGLAWYGVTGGLLVPLLYWLGFRLLGRAGAGPGVCLGVAHYLGSGLLLAASHPRRPKRSDGEGRPMGAFLSGYGVLERAANLVGHLADGLVVGTASGR
jgi:hypothetical protein